MHADVGALRNGYERASQIVQAELDAGGLHHHVSPRALVLDMPLAAVAWENKATGVAECAPRHQQRMHDIAHREVQWSASLGAMRWQPDDALAKINFVPTQRRPLSPAKSGEQ